MSRNAADLIQGRILANEYRWIARDIEEEAADPKYRGMPLTQRILRQYAAIARRAAIAEQMDPEPA